MSIYDQHLDKNAANHVALSPVSFVERSAEVFGDLPAVIHGARRLNWAQLRERSARLAAALRALLLRAESDPAFYQGLETACAGRRHLFTPEGELARWAALLGEL